MDRESLTPEQAFAEAVRLSNGQAGFERTTGMKQQTVSYRLKHNLRCPPEYVPAAEKATGISRHVLRPDVFGPTPATPAEMSVELAR